MRLGYTLLYVKNVEESLQFYERALGLKRKFLSVDSDQAYGELETGPTTLGFVSHALVAANGVEASRPLQGGPAPPFNISFVTDQVDANYKAAIAAGATDVAAPRDKPWGQRVAYIRDSDGFLVEICSEVPAAAP